jgi:hypothetical protein
MQHDPEATYSLTPEEIRQHKWHAQHGYVIIGFNFDPPTEFNPKDHPFGSVTNSIRRHVWRKIGLATKEEFEQASREIFGNSCPSPFEHHFKFVAMD